MDFKLGHLALNITDMERALEFYVGKLGLEHAFTIYDTVTDRPRIEYIRVADDQFIELFYSNDDLASIKTTYNHLCLCVEDVRAAAATLAARGVTIEKTPCIGQDMNWQFWIADPEGNLIEIGSWDKPYETKDQTDDP